ncbi:hypothetical protein [Nitrosomonas sp.]|uniref:hypothetical protein n=1 Tax=Nitrosomonas sp. TaxID=42353 RepID=UPI00272FCC89|nr:hypothetical protein [Nitrosomonas sp.]
MQRHRYFKRFASASASEQERQEKRKLCALLPSEMIQELPYTPGISTSDLVARVLDGVGSKETDLTHRA